MKHLKLYENFISNFFKKKSDDIVVSETQEEIDQKLIDAVEDNNYWDAIDAIKKGANVNSTVEQFSFYDNKYSLLMKACLRNTKLAIELIKNGADVYHQVHDGFDFLDWSNKIMSIDHRPIILKTILKYHPNFYEERELRKETDKYNL